MSESSIDLLTPRCAHFGVCGGCRFQTVPYSEQLREKEAFVKKLFEGMGGRWEPIIPCDPPWNYRNKMEFSFSQSRKGEKFLGLMMRGKRGRVTDLNECHLTSSWFCEVLGGVRRWWLGSPFSAYYPPTGEGLLRTLTLREGIKTGEKMAVLTVSFRPSDPFPEGLLESFKEAVLRAASLDTIVIRRHITQKGTPTYFEEEILHGKGFICEQLKDKKGKSLTFKIRPSSFFQPNTSQAERLYENALTLARLEEEDVLLDLYCGTGTIGMCAASSVRQVLGIELNPDAISDAHDNLAFNQITNMTVIQGDVGEVASLEMFPSTIVVDPPRAGLSPQAMTNVLNLNARKIIYISCNPVTQAENVKEFIKHGYEPVAFQPVDQFPHTPHIENIGCFSLIV